MTAGFPWALFGKRPGTAHDPFEIVHRSADFTEAAATAFDELTMSVRWKSDGSTAIYPPLAALWPIPGEPNLLIARIEDSGADAAGRPHVLRVRCIIVANEQDTNDAERIAELLTAEWPSDCETTQLATLTLAPTTLGRNTLAEMLVDFFRHHRRWPRLLCGSRRRLEAANFEQFYPQEELPEHEPTPAPNRELRAMEKISTSTSTAGFRPHLQSALPWTVILGAIAIALGVVVIKLWWDATSLQAQQIKAEQELAAAQSLSTAQQLDLLRQRTELTELRSSRDRLQEQLRDGQVEFQKWRDLARRHGVADYPDLEARLKAFDQKGTPAARSREQQLKQLSPIKRTLSDLEGNVNKLQKAVQSLEADHASP